jgi:hypothetical protein
MVAPRVVIGSEGRDQSVLGEIAGFEPTTFILRLKYKCRGQDVKSFP